MIIPYHIFKKLEAYKNAAKDFKGTDDPGFAANQIKEALTLFPGLNVYYIPQPGIEKMSPEKLNRELKKFVEAIETAIEISFEHIKQKSAGLRIRKVKVIEKKHAGLSPDPKEEAELIKAYRAEMLDRLRETKKPEDNNNN